MRQEGPPPAISAVRNNVEITEGHELEINPVEHGRGEVRLLMFFGARRSFKEGNGVFKAVVPEIGSAPFRIIGEEDDALEFAFLEVDGVGVVAGGS